MSSQSSSHNNMSQPQSDEQPQSQAAQSPQPEPTAAEKFRQNNPEKYARLKAESKAPYRNLRRFVYLSLAASGFIGAFTFLMRILAGKGILTENLGSLALQISIVALMILAFRRDRPKSTKP
jgi:membrane glycosyltransferase